MLQLSKHPQRGRKVYLLASLLVILSSSVVVLAQAKKDKGVITVEQPDEAAVNAVDNRYFTALPNTKVLADGRVAFTKLERMPELEPNLTEWLMNHLRYPEVARAQGQQGSAVVQFLIDEKGYLSSPTLTASSGHALLDEEALRVVNQMPQWKPGKTHEGQKVPTLLTLPIHFKLDEHGKPIPNGGC